MKVIWQSTVDKAIATINRLTFLAHPAYASVTAISREEDESTLALQ